MESAKWIAGAELGESECARLRKINAELVATLEALHCWVSPSNDWRPDSKLAHDVRAAIAKARSREDSSDDCSGV